MADSFSFMVILISRELNISNGLFTWAEVLSVAEKTFRQVMQIILFCSCGEMFSRLPGKVSCYDVDFVKCKQKVFPLSGKVVFI